jgi:hypothetical protein
MKRILGGAAMKRILGWCTALILLSASSLALAVTTSAPQEGLVKVMPPGTTNPPGTTTPPSTTLCDIGPPYTGSIPAAAAQAGMTHCRANYDFTYTGSFTDSLGSHTWTNYSSWLNCNKNAATPYLLLYAGDSSCDQTHFLITTDQGVQVLALSLLTSDVADGIGKTELVTNNGSASDITGGGYYTEMVTRVSNNTPCSAYCPYFDQSSFSDNNNGGNGPFVSSDQEYDNTATNTGVGLAQWNLQSPGNNGDGWPSGTGPTSGADCVISSTSYNTCGRLVTEDNVSDFAGCDYAAPGNVMGLPPSAFGSCSGAVQVIPPSTSAVFTNTMFFYLEEGSSIAQGINNLTTNITTYIQRFTIWDCPSPTNGQCFNNPVITMHP